jgi:Flp pilus assembly protein TadD
VADALALIDRGAAPATTGIILLDAPAIPRDVRSQWLADAADRLEKRGLAQRVVHDVTAQGLQNQATVLGYYSWGSNDPALAVRHPNLTFVPGALASMFLSTDARTLVEPPADWKPGKGISQALFAGSSQSLSGDLVRSGATGVAGQVAEPTLGGAIRPDILFPAYLAGFNLAESFYLAMPFLSWQTVIIGDPLCAPFRPATLTATDPNPPLDPDTELPTLFSARRMTSIPGLAISPSLKLLLRAEARSARGDSAGAVEALNQVMATDDATPGSKVSRLAAEAWRELAYSHQDEGRYSEANDLYRRLLAGNPNDIFALNNLAYNLATHLDQPHEALPLALRAAALAPEHPFVMHTLGWTQHLLGNNAEALRLLEPVVRARSGDADMRFHVAIVYAALGRYDDAANALKIALNLNPALRNRPEFRDVQQKISARQF